MPCIYELDIGFDMLNWEFLTKKQRSSNSMTSTLQVPSRMSSDPRPASTAGLEAGPRPQLMPFQGSFQLTFFNQFQLETSSVTDLFAQYGNIKEGRMFTFSIVQRFIIIQGV